ncbi:MAG TPA: MtrB/PioB family outer membrane beta-barrel protein [Vicinamibacterales bacterium]|nr:MtrB/PioB family outer membrane beta-barrel protein [Vicinamibacterales bacterium]
MRTRTFIVAAALLLAPATIWAQVPGSPPHIPPTIVPQGPSTGTSPFSVGFLDFGIRNTTADGDATRYERYRDLRDGLFLESALIAVNQNDWNFGFAGSHMGMKDQRMIVGGSNQGRIKGWFMWDQIPMLLSRTTQTFFEGDVINNNGVLRIADPIQQQGQANANNIPLLFAPPNTQVFSIGTERHIAESGVSLHLTKDTEFRGLFRNTAKTGGIPYGGSFGHSQLVETIAPVEHTTRDAEASLEYVHDRYLFRAGYVGSFFTNDNTTLTFDNPFRLQDTTSASSRGRSSLPPSSTFFSVNGMASMRLPGHSRVTGYISSGLLEDAGDPIMPQTVNTAVVGINPLPRTTVDGKARTLASTVTFTSRPLTKVDFNARFRSYDYDNQTPVFITSQRVSYDNAVSNLNPAIETEPFGVSRQIFDGQARYLWRPGTNIGVGYLFQREARSHRIYEDVTDNGVYATFDTVGNQWFTVRTRYEFTVRRGNGLDETLLSEVGEQTGMRHMDLAPRDRNRITVIGVLTPMENVAFNVSATAGKDDYLQSQFGLRDNNHQVYSAGIDWTPREHVAFSASYSFEDYAALSRSRQANPDTPTGCANTYPPPAGKVACQFYDPSRDWSVDTDEFVHSFILNADFLNIKNRFDLRVAYDSNRYSGTYHYITGSVPDRTLPDEVTGVPSTLPDPVQLPDVHSNLDRLTADFVYNFNRRVGLGVSYWFEKYGVQDFALDAESVGNGVTNQAVLLGYMYTPYTAQTGWLRLIVRW